ncbi:head-to-tail stopper [Gordonia phage Keelan]|nr:head-to-tail stopper [Gordonia phage Keelan]
MQGILSHLPRNTVIQIARRASQVKNAANETIVSYAAPIQVNIFGWVRRQGPDTVEFDSAGDHFENRIELYVPSDIRIGLEDLVSLDGETWFISKSLGADYDHGPFAPVGCTIYIISDEVEAPKWSL